MLKNTNVERSGGRRRLRQGGGDFCSRVCACVCVFVHVLTIKNTLSEQIFMSVCSGHLLLFYLLPVEP